MGICICTGGGGTNLGARPVTNAGANGDTTLGKLGISGRWRAAINSMFAAEIMSAIYREILDQIPAVQFDVYRNRLSVSKSRRLKVALSIWLKSKFKR